MLRSGIARAASGGGALQPPSAPGEGSRAPIRARGMMSSSRHVSYGSNPALGASSRHVCLAAVSGLHLERCHRSQMCHSSDDGPEHSSRGRHGFDTARTAGFIGSGEGCTIGKLPDRNPAMSEIRIAPYVAKVPVVVRPTPKLPNALCAVRAVRLYKQIGPSRIVRPGPMMMVDDWRYINRSGERGSRSRRLCGS